jgi:hypothetical protein
LRYGFALPLHHQSFYGLRLAFFSFSQLFVLQKRWFHMKRLLAFIVILLFLFLHTRRYRNHEMEGVADVSRWRVTIVNPPREGQELDFERCAAFHNHILELGWVGSGRDLAALDRRSWWEFHGAAAEAIRHRLGPSLIEFLKRAQIGTSDQEWHWYYYFKSLSYPEQLFSARETDDDDVVLLYALSLSLSHPRGLL